MSTWDGRAPVVWPDSHDIAHHIVAEVSYFSVLPSPKWGEWRLTESDREPGDLEGDAPDDEPELIDNDPVPPDAPDPDAA